MEGGRKSPDESSCSFVGSVLLLLWWAESLVTVLTDPASHPHASGDYDPWCRPEPRRDFFLSLAFAAQRGGSKMLREAGKRRRDRRADGRYATGTRA